MSISVNGFVMMRMSGLIFWTLYVFPKIIYSVFNYWSRFKDLNYLLLSMLLSKMCADISLVSSMFLENRNLEIVSCGIYSIFFTLKLTLDYTFTEKFIFYQVKPLGRIFFIQILILFNYFSISMYIFFPYSMTFILPVYLFGYFILLKLKRRLLMSELTILIELFDTNGWIEQMNYTKLYMKLNPSSNLFYIFTIFEIIFFQYDSSKKFAFIIYIYEIFFLIDNSVIASNFLSSDMFFENPITNNSLIESNRLKLYEIGLTSSLVLSLGKNVAIVTPGTHEILIGEAIEDYLIYI